MAWLPDGEKKFEDTFIRFDTIYERDTNPHRQAHRHRVTSDGENRVIYTVIGFESIPACDRQTDGQTDTPPSMCCR